MKRLMTVVAVVAIGVGCPSYTPPAIQPPAPQDLVVHAPLESVWTEVVTMFADSKVPISTMDKASGVIISKDFRMSATQSKAWLDCGKFSAGTSVASVSNPVATFNVLLHTSGDSTVVRFTLSAEETIQVSQLGTGPVTTQTEACASTGDFERLLAARLKGVATGK